MRKEYIWIVFIMLSIILGCQHNNGINETMSQADRIMEAEQDSAIVSLKILDKLQQQTSNMSKSQRMRYELLYAKAMNKANIKFTSDSMAKQITDYYEHHGTNSDKLMAYYLLGSVYRDLNDAPTAIRMFNIATNYMGNDLYSFLMVSRIHNQIAELYDSQAMTDMEISEIDKSVHYALLSGDTIDAITIYNMKSSAYSYIDQLDSAATINKTAMKMFMDRGYETYAAQISLSGIRYYLREKQYDEAKKRFDFYEQKSGYFHNGEIDSGRELFYYLKALYFLEINKNDSAEQLFRKCLDFKDDANMAVAGYHGLSMLYQKTAKPDSTAKYAMLAYNANDSCYKEKTAQLLLQQQSIYNYNKYKDDAKRSADRTIVLQRWLMLSLIALIVLSCIVLIVYRKKRKEHAIQIETMRSKYETEKILLNNELQEISRLSDDRRNLLKHKDELMETREKEVELEIMNKSKYIDELKSRIKEYERELNIKDLAQMENEIQNSKIKSQFEYYLKNVTEHPTSALWKELDAFSKDFTPKLFVMLRNYNATEREFRICLLIRLMFKPSDIATLIGCSLSDVSLTRSRLLKKIYQIEGSPSELDKRIRLVY